MGKYRQLIDRMAGSVDYWTQAAMRRFVLEIDRRMKAQDISRAELAEKLKTSPAYVTKVMRGDVNFTLETMTKLAMAVGGKLKIEVVEKDASLWNNDSLIDVKAEETDWYSHAWCTSKGRKLTDVDVTRKVQLSHKDIVVANQPCYYESRAVM